MRSVVRATLIVLLIIEIGSSKIYADDTTYTNGDGFEHSIGEYIPEYISEVLADKDFENDKPPDVQDVLKKCLEEFKSSICDNEHSLMIIIVLVFVSAVLKSVINDRFVIIYSFVSKLSILSIIITNYAGMINIFEECIDNLLDLLNAVSPSLTAAYLLSGATFSATTSSASISVLISIVAKLLGTPLLNISVITVGLLTAEVFAPNSIRISKALKKSLVSLIGFVFSIMVTVISLNGMLAASKDSVSLRTVKFATVKLVPIIGSSVSEAMKNITVGISVIRTQLGVYVICALLILVLPTVLKLMLFKLTMKLLGVLSGALSVNECDCIFEGFSDISDVFIAIIIGVLISIVLLLIIFCSAAVSL